MRYRVGQRVFAASANFGEASGRIVGIRPEPFPYLIQPEDGELVYALDREIVTDLPASGRIEDVEAWLEES